MGSSYDKVVNLTRGTEAYRALTDRAERRFASLRLGALSAQPAFDGTPRLYVQILAGAGPEEAALEREEGYGSVRFEHVQGLLTPRQEVDGVVDATFGQLVPGYRKRFVVPTYFCKASKVKEELAKAVDADVRNALDDALQPRFRAMEAELAALTASPEAAAVRQECKDDFVVKKVKEVLLRFKDASPAVLKRALGEFVVHSITED